tara:strand:+ start:218 stop:598 length:381 start_codon:yes stop_codon:yes gene_type:complete
MVLMIYFIWFINLNQDDWKTYYADKKVEISFKSELCDDRKNGFAFEYYIIRVKNLTDKTYVINFFKGPEENLEEKIAFVLKPFETKTGKCEYDPIKLRIFKSEKIKSKSEPKIDFNLSKIDVIEVQ